MLEETVATAKVFSDANRIRILALLQREGNLCVCALCDTLQLSQPLVSRHLKQMRQAKLVTSHQQGKWTLYGINTTHPLYNHCRPMLENIIPHLPPLIECARLNHGS